MCSLAACSDYFDLGFVSSLEDFLSLISLLLFGHIYNVRGEFILGAICVPLGCKIVFPLHLTTMCWNSDKNEFFTNMISGWTLVT